MAILDIIKSYEELFRVIKKGDRVIRMLNHKKASNNESLIIFAMIDRAVQIVVSLERVCQVVHISCRPRCFE